MQRVEKAVLGKPEGQESQGRVPSWGNDAGVSASRAMTPGERKAGPARWWNQLAGRQAPGVLESKARQGSKADARELRRCKQKQSGQRPARSRGKPGDLREGNTGTRCQAQAQGAARDEPLRQAI